MKRSEINRVLRSSVAFLRENKFELPPFAYWTPAQWRRKKRPEVAEIIDTMLGWDLTDFGKGRFREFGLTLFTIRNGHQRDKRYPKPYAEKAMICLEDQMTPMHFHWNKTEDIINRGGGEMMIRLCSATRTGKLSGGDVRFGADGVRRRVRAGSVLRFERGESLTLEPGLYHSFWAKRGKGAVLLGEVSSVNDDHTDNRFLDPIGRFPTIEEDAAPLHYIVGDYEGLRLRR